MDSSESTRPSVRRGDVWFVALDPVIGSEEAKTRPCVVVQRDGGTEKQRTTIVVPVTDAANQAVSIVQPLIRAGNGGLPKDSVALCMHPRAVDRLRFRRRLGAVDEAGMAEIGVGLLAILDLSQPTPGG